MNNDKSVVAIEEVNKEINSEADNGRG